MMTRRRWVTGSLAAAAAALGSTWWSSRDSLGATFPVTHSDTEWRSLLTPDAYQVLRHEATERPGTSALLQEHRRGTFHCAGCALALFSSTTKFESGTGWPSFWAPLDKAVGTKSDFSFGMMRKAVFCAQCGGHLGHLFDDGPQPTGLRYCMNGVAMTFKASSSS
jgi:peptide-methionine (R)-S-oxide reductase